MNGSDEELHAIAAARVSENRFVDAFSIYEALSERGYTQCQVYAGWMLFEGIGVTRDRNRALAYLRNAASSKEPIALFYFGRALTIEGQHDEAIRWYRLAADQNYVPALFRMGVCHLEGQGTSRDVPAAIGYFRCAAQAGHILARGQLARLYLAGKAGLLMIPIGLVLVLRLPFDAWRVASRRQEFAEELVG